MKAIIVSGSIIAVLGLFSCGNHSERKEGTKSNFEQEIHACYLYKNENDTISLTIDIAEATVTGNMIYDFFEKDGSKGTIQGHISGDTLIADYDFMSEGVQSQSEVVFLKKDGDYWLGIGDGEVVNDKWIFNDRGQLDFKEIQLRKVDCK